MYDGYDWMWGMHWGWWIVFILIIVLAFWRRRPGPHTPASRKTPLEILQRRYADGEITTKEYEERKTHLERDRL